MDIPHSDLFKLSMESSDYYQSRINRALNFLNNHLDEKISVAQLADAAHFSTFHFQRIYKAFQNETPYETIIRLRLEKSVFLLKNHQDLKINEIASEVGFSSVENFTRQFKVRYGCTPGKLKIGDSRIHQVHEQNQAQIVREKWDAADCPFQVTIEALPTINVALIRANFGADGSGLVEAYERLMSWYEAQGKRRTGSQRFGMSIDDPEVTPAKVYRYDFAIATDKTENAAGLIEQIQIPGGQYATLYCQGDIAIVGKAWDYLYRHWLPESGYVPLHFPAIEEFVQGPEEIGWTQFNLKCRIPIKKI